MDKAIMEQRFRYLFGRYLNNSCSEKELDEFFLILSRSDDDERLRSLIQQVYADLKETTPDITSVDQKGRLIVTEPEWVAPVSGPVARIKSAWLTRISIAALMLVIAGSIFFIRNSLPASRNNLSLSSLTKRTTGRAESKFLLLPDSSQVWLNAASSLEYPEQFKKGKREVYLSGEAYFDVKHADKIPFIIHTGKVSTTVLGTAFNIRAYPGQKKIVVSVTRGKVIVSDEEGWTTTLGGGEKVNMEDKGRKLVEKNIPEIEVAAWQKGNIVYEDETFGDIVADIERVYNVTVSLEKLSLSDLKISTSFKKEIGIAQALQFLCKLTDSQFKKIDEAYIIY